MTRRSSQGRSAETSATSRSPATGSGSPGSSPTSTESPRRRSAPSTPRPGRGTATSRASSRARTATAMEPIQTDRTNVLQISTNPANTRLVAVGNFTTVNGASPLTDRPVRHRQRDAHADALEHHAVQVGVLAQLRDDHDRRRVLAERLVLRGLDDRRLRRREQQHRRHLRLRRGRPVREQQHLLGVQGDLDGVHRRRHDLDRRGHRQRRVRRRPPALAEQPRRPATPPARARSAARASPRSTR